MSLRSTNDLTHVDYVGCVLQRTSEFRHSASDLPSSKNPDEQDKKGIVSTYQRLTKPTMYSSFDDPLFCFLFLSSLPDHIPPELHQQQRRHRGCSEPQRSSVHCDQPKAGVRLRVPYHRTDKEGLGRSSRGSGGHHGETRYAPVGFNNKVSDFCLRKMIILIKLDWLIYFDGSVIWRSLAEIYGNRSASERGTDVRHDLLRAAESHP